VADSCGNGNETFCFMGGWVVVVVVVVVVGGGD
jgi:hypothetical protein